MAEHRSAAATRRDAAGPTTPPPAPPPPLAPVPVPDLASMQPTSPTDVVAWARSHLGVDKSFVVARAVALEPDQERRREPAQLQALWRDLVAQAAEADSPAPESSENATATDEGNRAEAGPVSEPSPTDDIDHYLAELDDSAEAPSHAHDIEQKIKAVFPGTEFVDLPDPEDGEAG